MKCLFLIAIISVLVIAAHAEESDERYSVRNRRTRVRDSAAQNGKVRRGTNKIKDEELAIDVSSFSQEQLLTFRRLGITCGGSGGDGYGKEGSGKEGSGYGKEGSGYGKQGGSYGKQGTGSDYGKQGSSYGKEGGGYYGKEGSKEGGGYYGKEGSKEGNQRRRRRQRRNRRLAMRAFTYHRAGECICDEVLGVCWIWGDQHDDPICCQPDGVDHFPVAAPVEAPVQSPVAPPASLSPPLDDDERTWSNDMPTFIPAGF